MANIINGIEVIIIPENRKMIDGIIDKNNALDRRSVFQKTTQKNKYAPTKIAFVTI